MGGRWSWFWGLPKGGMEGWMSDMVPVLSEFISLPGIQHWTQAMGGSLYSWGLDQHNIKRIFWEPCGGLSTRLIGSKCWQSCRGLNQRIQSKVQFLKLCRCLHPCVHHSSPEQSSRHMMNKKIVVHPCSGLLLSHKKEWGSDTCYLSLPVFLPREPPWTEEPGGLQSVGLQRVRQDWETNTFTFHPMKRLHVENHWLVDLNSNVCVCVYVCVLE